MAWSRSPGLGQRRGLDRGDWTEQGTGKCCPKPLEANEAVLPLGCHLQPYPMGTLWALSWGNIRALNIPILLHPDFTQILPDVLVSPPLTRSGKPGRNTQSSAGPQDKAFISHL